MILLFKIFIFQNNVLLTPKKEIENVQQANSSKSYNNIDLDHVYIEFQQPFHAWIEAKHVVQEVIANL